jgi:hypothetical protein
MKANRIKNLLLFLLLIFNTSVYSQNWDEIIKTTASDRERNDEFGYSVSISGDYVIVGAYKDSEDELGVNTLSNAGSAYIFEEDGSESWVEVQKIVASDRGEDNYFGESV